MFWQRTVHGMSTSHSTHNGNNGTAKVTANTTVWFKEKRKEKPMVLCLLNIMENGHSNVSIFFRYFLIKAQSISCCISLHVGIVLQEPVSAILSLLSLVIQFKCWFSYHQLLHYKLPLRPQSQRTFYEFTELWHVSWLLSMNASFWSAIFHTRYKKSTT